MSITLNVLEHLGLSLYSSSPAVLSEAVANAWDANAHGVDIDIDSVTPRIVITDDGDGMTRAELNDKFLTVGYHRRESGEPEATQNRLGRHVMGRKGIGKLSLSLRDRELDRNPDGQDHARRPGGRAQRIFSCAPTRSAPAPKPTRNITPSRNGVCSGRARVHVRTQERSRGMKAPPRRLTGDGHRVAPHLTAPAPTTIRL